MANLPPFPLSKGFWVRLYPAHLGLDGVNNTRRLDDLAVVVPVDGCQLLRRGLEAVECGNQQRAVSTKDKAVVIFSLLISTATSHLPWTSMLEKPYKPHTNNHHQVRCLLRITHVVFVLYLCSRATGTRSFLHIPSISHNHVCHSVPSESPFHFLCVARPANTHPCFTAA